MKKIPTCNSIQSKKKPSKRGLKGIIVKGPSALQSTSVLEMDTVIFVSPVLYFQDHSNAERWKSVKPKPGYVPILNSDLAKFEQTLKQAHGDNVRRTVIEGADQVDKNLDNQTQGGGNAESSGTFSLKSRFVDLQSFLPISLEQQLHTICLGHVPLGLGVKGIDRVIEKLEQVLIKCLDADSTTKYVKQWSYVDCVNSFTVYVSFQEELTKDYARAIGVIQQLLEANTDGISLSMDENTSRYVSDLKQDSSFTVTDSIKDGFWQLVDVLKAGSESNTHDKGSSVEYTVDLSTLSDLPSSSLDQLCKDIVEFRTRVITLEKEKRNKELIEAEKRRRQHLKQIFDKIKNAEGSSKVDKNSDGEDDDDDDDDDNDNDNDNTNTNDSEYPDERDDYEAEQKRLKAEVEAQQNAYENLVHDFQDKMLVEYSSLRQELHHLQNYEAQLLKNRGPLLKEFMHLASDPHYDHHRAYKETEQKTDEEDRIVEAREMEHKTQDSAVVTEVTSAHESAEPKIKLALRQVKQEEDYKEDQDEQQEQVHEIPPEFLQKVELLKKSGVVDELVKEFLGVYEPDLVEYIFDNIKEHQSRETLEKELAETFDEDSPVLVDRIWTAMETDS